MLLSFCKWKGSKKWGRDRHEKTRGDERFPADNNAAGNVKDDSAIARRSAEAATKKSNPAAAIYAVHVEPQQQQSQALVSVIDRLAPKENHWQFLKVLALISTIEKVITVFLFLFCEKCWVNVM